MISFSISGIIHSNLENIPNTSGVYQFLGNTGIPIYIGKSIHLRKRIHSYFTAKQHEKSFEIAREAERLKIIPTAGELGALLREAQLIQTLKPKYNRMLRGLSWPYVALKKKHHNGYFSVNLEEVECITQQMIPHVICVEKTKRGMDRYLSEMRHEHQLCEKYFGKKVDGACFNYHIKKCKGACIGEESVDEYNKRFTKAFEKSMIQPWPYSASQTVNETSNDASESFTISSWTHIQSDQGFTFTSGRFDYDVYRIVRKML